MTVIAYHKVHTALATGEAFKGISRHGRYGDNVEELDWSVGKILDTISQLKLKENTFVYFTSDHGPALHMKVNGEMHGGWKRIFKGGKGSSWEGGIRVPTVVRYPGVIPKGRVYNKPTSGLDLFPTLLSVTGSDQIDDRIIDGLDIMNVLKGGKEIRERFIFHHCGTRLQAVTYSSQHYNKVWKLHFEIQKWDNDTEFCFDICPCFGDGIVVLTSPVLYELVDDQEESKPIASNGTYAYIHAHIVQAYDDHKKGLTYAENMLTAEKNGLFFVRKTNVL